MMNLTFSVFCKKENLCEDMTFFQKNPYGKKCKKHTKKGKIALPYFRGECYNTSMTCLSSGGMK